MRYIVWRHPKDASFEVWTEKHFRYVGVNPPAEKDPDRIYAGDNYAEALAAARRANKPGAKLAMIREGMKAPKPSAPQKRAARSAAMATASMF